MIVKRAALAVRIALELVMAVAAKVGASVIVFRLTLEVDEKGFRNY